MLLRHRRICWDCCGLLVSSGNIIDSDRSDGDDNDADDNDDSDDSDDGDGDDNDDSDDNDGDDSDGDDSDRDSTKQLIASLSSSHLYISVSPLYLCLCWMTAYAFFLWKVTSRMLQGPQGELGRVG